MRTTRVDEAILGGDALSAEEQALLTADQANSAPETAPSEGAAPAAPAQEPAAETLADPEDPAAPPARQPQTVPLAVLMEEREQRKELQRRLADEAKARQTIEERTNLILQQMRQQQAQQAPAPQQAGPQLPAIEQDPVGHLMGRLNQSEALLGAVVQALQGQSQQQQQQQNFSAIQARARAMEQEFATQTPDYDAAASHLANARRDELRAQGFTDPAELQAMMGQEAAGLYAQAVRQGRNPAEVVYQLAKLRGYAAPPVPVAAPAVAGALQVPDAEAEQQLRAIERGQQQGRSVGSLRGTGPAPLTAQRLGEMTDDDFDKMMRTPEGRALMGV